MTLDEPIQKTESKPIKKNKVKKLWIFTKTPLRLLERLISKATTRRKRSRILLADPESNEDKGWYFYVPNTFNSALDFKLTERMGKGKQQLVWTQDLGFSFQSGDTLYDTPAAYYSPWCEAVKHIKCCIRIEQGIAAIPAFRDNSYSPGFVRFSLMTPDHYHAKLIKRATLEMTQAEFVRFLIVGPSKEIQSKYRLPDSHRISEQIDITFSVKEPEIGEPWIIIEPLEDSSSGLSEELCGFILPSGTTKEEAETLCKFLCLNIQTLQHMNVNPDKTVVSDKWEFYQDKKCEWRWRRKASNGRIVGASSEGYKTYEYCVRNAARNGYKRCPTNG